MEPVLAYDRIDSSGNYVCGPETDSIWSNNTICLNATFPHRDRLARQKTEILLDQNVKFAYIVSWRYYVGYTSLTGSVVQHFQWILSSNILSALRDGRCLLILDDSAEGIRQEDTFYDKFTELADMIGMPHSNLIFADGNYYNQIDTNKVSDIKCVYENLFEDALYSYAANNKILEKDIHHIKDKPFRYLSYARHWNHSRQYFTYDLFSRDLLRHGLVSCAEGNNYYGRDKYFTEQLKSAWLSEPGLYNKDMADKFLKSLPYNLDTDLVDNLAINLNLQHYLDTDISVIHETHCSNETIFVSEKIYKPIMVGQPFLIMGSPGILDAIRADGYKTFHPYIDESYDKEHNLIKRKDMVLDELIKIIYMPSNIRIELREKLDEIAEYNRAHFKNYAERLTRGSSITKLIINHCTGGAHALQ